MIGGDGMLSLELLAIRIDIAPLKTDVVAVLFCGPLCEE